MKKTIFIIIILVAIVLFGGTDYFFNLRSTPIIPTRNDELDDMSGPNLSEDLLSQDENGYGYQITQRNRVSQIFEKIDLSRIKNIKIFQSYLEGKDSSLNFDPITIYEVHGPSAQGSLTYLNVKLKFIDQIDATININEVGSFGHNSFFFNNKNSEETGFLLVQIKDNLFGFQYNKNNETLFETIRTMIDNKTKMSVIE